MILYFLDTSALVKRYRIEQGTASILALFRDAESPLQISELTLVEITSAFQRLKNSGEIAAEAIEEALGKFDADTEQRLTIIKLTSDLIRQAKHNVVKHNLRPLDALQLACALSIKAQLPVFVAADDNLLVAAKAEGFVTLNPLKESPTPREDVPDSPPQ